MPFRQFLPTAQAADYIGVSVQTLAGWRRRGAGPAYAALPSTHGRNRAGKRHAIVVYPVEELDQFAHRYMVQESRLPRPFPGRMPGGRNRR